MHDHRPAAEVEGLNFAFSAVEVAARHVGTPEPEPGHLFQHIPRDGQIPKTVVQSSLTPALDPFVEDRIDGAALDRRPSRRIARVWHRMNLAAPSAYVGGRKPGGTEQ